MTRAALYARVSRTDQDCAVQLDALRRHATARPGRARAARSSPRRRRFAAWVAAGCAAVLLLTGCAALSGSRERYRLGDITVVVMAPEEVARLCALLKPLPAGRYYRGCYILATQTVIAPADHRILLHELKHALEGDFHEEAK